MPMDTIRELFDLSGKAAVVTGAGSGIGRGIALRLAEAGAGVMITDIDLEAAGESARQIRTRGGRAEVVRADAASMPDATTVVQATVASFGRIDILVNNAGMYPFSPVLEITEAAWDKVLSVDLKGMFFQSQAAAQEMTKAGGGGRIINIASIAGLHPTGDQAHYNAAKGGVVMLTKALALELAPHGILVNAVAPGAIATPGGQAVAAARLASGKPVGFTSERIALGRYGKPDDIAKVVLFLASRAAGYITGSVILVDGGCSLT